VAEREHEALMQLMDLIDCLPPGLYELVVTPKVAGEPGADLVSGDFLSRIEARLLDDIRAFGRNSEDDDRAFATAARVSEIGLANYRTYLQPIVKAIASEQIANAIRAMNPVRAQYTMFADSNPMMKTVAETAEKVRANRHPVAPDNMLLQLQEQMADAIMAGWNAFRDMRDKAEEQTFFAIYGSPVVQAMVGTSAGVYQPRRPPAKTPEERATEAATLAAYRADIGKGGSAEAKFRSLLYVLEADRSFDERSAFALRTAAPELAGLPLDEVKRIAREQFFALQLDREHAVRSLASMVKADDERRRLVAEVRAIVEAAGTPTPETARRMQAVAEVLGGSAMQRVGETPQPAPKPEAVRKRG